MKYCFITMRSLTIAQKAEAVLRRNGIRCSVQRAPRWMEEQGCGNGVRVACEDIENALYILQEGAFPINGHIFIGTMVRWRCFHDLFG